jgi:hypothetical protein
VSPTANTPGTVVSSKSGGYGEKAERTTQRSQVMKMRSCTV